MGARIEVADLAGERTRSEIFALALTEGPSPAPPCPTPGPRPLVYHARAAPAARSGLPAGDRRTASGTRASPAPARGHAERHLVVGIKIGPSQVSGVVTDLAARVLAGATKPIADCTPTTALPAASALADRLQPVPHTRDRLLGVGLDGHVDPARGVCLYSSLLDRHKVDVAGPVSAATELPVIVNSAVNALAVAEHWFGHGKGVDSFAVVTVVPGIGCGLVLGGELFCGKGGLAGELGHLPLDPAGPMCSRGCLEALARDRAVLRHIHDAGVSDCATFGDAVALARSGSPRRARRSAGAWPTCATSSTWRRSSLRAKARSPTTCSAPRCTRRSGRAPSPTPRATAPST
ncbi:ROK family protein [Streptomyces sp. NBC_00316]|nr:ROK family protein [Streptomyces sp. NBC_00316]